VSLLEYATIGKDAVVYASLAVLLAVVMFPVVSYGIKKLFRQGFAFVLIAFCFLYAMANKPDPGTYPQITWSAGLFNSGSTFNTNTWKTINFRWSNNATVSLTNTIYFAAKDRNYPDLEYFELGSTQVEQHQWSYTFDGQENVTNYIYDGLVAMWDGLDNVGYGCAHDADATVWKDLVGTRNASLVTANASFVADALNCTGSAAATEPLARAPTVRTIEVVCEAKTSGNAYLADPGSSVRLMFSGGKMLCEYMGPLFLLPTNRATYAVTAAADGKRFHVNGNWQVARSGADYFNLSETGYIGGTGYTGKIYAVRFYDRILTSVELAHNADLDQKRFFNAPPQDADRSSRKRQDGTVEHRVRVTADKGGYVTCGETTAPQLDFWVANGATVALTAGTSAKYLFLGWRSTMGSLIAEADMRSNALTFAVTDAVQLKAQFVRGETAYRDPTAASYVREGLIAQWDGLENVGLGLPHDAQANVWKDLVGTNDMAVVSPRGVFTENALNCTSSSSSYAAGSGATYSDLVTVEVVCDGIVSSEGFALYAGTSVKSVIVCPNRIFWAGDQYYRFSRAQTTLARVNTTCYAEGLPVERVGNNDSWGNRGTLLSFGAPAGKDDYRYYGRIYAVRLYNRALTQDELVYNYAIDSRRFFGLARPYYPGMTIVIR